MWYEDNIENPYPTQGESCFGLHGIPWATHSIFCVEEKEMIGRRSGLTVKQVSLASPLNRLTDLSHLSPGGLLDVEQTQEGQEVSESRTDEEKLFPSHPFSHFRARERGALKLNNRQKGARGKPQSSQMK